MTSIAVANRKGGCGKTMLSLNLAGLFAARGNRVLLLDLDPQASLSEILHRYADLVQTPISHAFVSGSLENSITTTDIPNIDFVPADEGLSDINRGQDPASRRTIRGRERLLADLFARSENVLSQYSVIVMDTPPDTKGEITSSALVASDLIVVPIDPHAGARGAAADIVTLADELRPFSVRSMVLALVLNRIKMQTGSYDYQVAEMAKEAFGDIACKTIIPSWIAFPKAAEEGLPVPFVKGSDFARATRLLEELTLELNGRLDISLKM